jgi:hypothetical protein
MLVELSGLQPNLIVPTKLIPPINTAHELIVHTNTLWAWYINTGPILLPTTNSLLNISPGICGQHENWPCVLPHSELYISQLPVLSVSSIPQSSLYKWLIYPRGYGSAPLHS